MNAWPLDFLCLIGFVVLAVALLLSLFLLCVGLSCWYRGASLRCELEFHATGWLQEDDSTYTLRCSRCGKRFAGGASWIC